MREIILDTETTGLDHTSGDRIVEIGGVELLNRFPTNRSFHVYINPERPMSLEAEKVHGLSDIFLADKPSFAEHVEAFLNFVGDASSSSIMRASTSASSTPSSRAPATRLCASTASSIRSRSHGASIPAPRTASMLYVRATASTIPTG